MHTNLSKLSCSYQQGQQSGTFTPQKHPPFGHAPVEVSSHATSEAHKTWESQHGMDGKSHMGIISTEFNETI